MPASPSTSLAALSRRAFVASASLAAAGAAVLPRLAHAEEGDAQVVIFHTNDTHGYLQGDGESCVGIDVVAGLRDATPNSLLVDAGDATQGAPLASLTKGESPIDLMNAAGYDAMCLGNHEFDFGRETLLANAAAAQFPVLGANVILDETGAPLLEGTVNAAGAELNGASCVLECAGRRIGVFGLTTQATAWSASPAATEGVTFADEVETAEAQIAELAAQGVDAIVCLAHLGNGTVPCTGPDLAENLSASAASRLAAIIDGHSHTVENSEVNGVLVVQTGCNLAAVGKLTLSFAADGMVTASEELIDPATATGEASPDEGVASELEAVVAAQSELTGEQLCVNPTTLWGGWLSGDSLAAPTRMVETNYGDFACECFVNRATEFLQQAGLDDGTPVVAVENGGAIRAAMPRGVVTMGDLVSAFPYSNTVQVKRVTPKVLRSLFEGSFSDMAGIDASGMLLQETVSGGYLQTAGIELGCDPDAVVGGRVTSMYVYGLGDVDLDDDETPIYLVSNSYVMAGGDSYAALADCETVAEVGGELESVRAYMDELADAIGRGIGVRCMPLLAGTKGRLAYDDCPEAPWIATLLLTDDAGEPLANARVLLEIDATSVVETVSDADGYVRLDLEDGPHAIAAHDPDGWVAMTYEMQAAGLGFAWALDAGEYASILTSSMGELSTNAGGSFDAEAAYASMGAATDGIYLVEPASGSDEGGAHTMPDVVDGANGLTYVTAEAGNTQAMATMRALRAETVEAYVDNHMGVGLIEDDLRAYPTLTMTVEPDELRDEAARLRASLSSADAGTTAAASADAASPASDAAASHPSDAPASAASDEVPAPADDPAASTDGEVGGASATPDASAASE